jgi:hypothetical protein
MIRENTGNFYGFGPRGATIKPKKPCPRWSFCRNSLLNGTGNYFGGTGNFFDVTGNSIHRTGKPLPASLLSEGSPQPRNRNLKFENAEKSDLLAMSS